MEVKENEELLLLLTNKGDEDKFIRHLDTGACNHMSGNKELFTNLSERHTGTISFGDDSKIQL